MVSPSWRMARPRRACENAVRPGWFRPIMAPARLTTKATPGQDTALSEVPWRRSLGGDRRLRQLVLRRHQPAHDLEIAVRKLQAGVGPDPNDAVEFVERYRHHLPAGLEHRPRPDMAALVALHVFAGSGNALPRLDHHVDEAGFLHFLRRIG